MNFSRYKGKIGERLAEDFLRAKGFETLKRNYFTRYGEIDLVMKDKDTIVFVEVKTGKRGRFGSPVEKITKRKKKRLLMAINAYLSENHICNLPLRIDCVVIEEAQNEQVKISYIPNAFEATAEPLAQEED